MDKRLNLLQSWLKNEIGVVYDSIEPASADASFRRYFRIHRPAANPSSWIVMDAPPEHEDNQRFIRCAKILRGCGLNTPEVQAANLEAGFLLISDLGTTTYQAQLNDETVDSLYGDAMAALLQLQRAAPSTDTQCPLYSAELLQTEMQLFEHWYAPHHRQTVLNAQQTHTLAGIYQQLINSAAEQPAVLVHRDYHCRNLLVTTQHNPGIIDFQDMVIGPVTYDLVSLLKDCYVQWPRERVLDWLDNYRRQALQSHIIDDVDAATWLRWFDWMGVQRHLKVLGIFARLNYRDGKAQYLNDLPLVNHYLTDTCRRYPELEPLADLLEQLHA